MNSRTFDYLAYECHTMLTSSSRRTQKCLQSRHSGWIGRRVWISNENKYCQVLFLTSMFLLNAFTNVIYFIMPFYFYLFVCVFISSNLFTVHEAKKHDILPAKKNLKMFMFFYAWKVEKQKHSFIVWSLNDAMGPWKI